MNLEPWNRQHRKAAGVHHRDLQLDGQFGSPVYQYLPIRNIAADSSRRPLEYGYNPAWGFQYYHQ